MVIRVGIENNNDDRSIAWALEHPGCFAYGSNALEAGKAMDRAAAEYAGWIQQHGMSWLSPDGLRVVVIETFDAYRIPRPQPAPGQKPTMMVESFFHADVRPLSGTDVERALKMLDWSRRDLLDVVKGLSDEQRNRVQPGERWSINGILKHIAGAEWWYQERIGSTFPEREEDLPPEPLEALELVRAHFLTFLPKLSDVSQMLKLEGEDWSPRKVLRRALWHERDHTQHIRKLL